MKTSQVNFSVAVLAVLGACTRASFSPIDQSDSGTGDTADEAVEARVCSAPTVSACTTQIATGAPCDPVCQAGTCDWCSQKCSLAGDGSTVCSSVGTRTTGSACVVSLAGTASQYDNCVAGDICLSPVLGSGVFYCFVNCRSSTDCPGGVACASRDIALTSSGSYITTTVCDPTYHKCDSSVAGSCCNPVADTGCSTGQFCYLVTPDPQTNDSRTVCEYGTGIGGRSSVCSSSRDCSEGWACGAAGVCQKVCDPTASNPCSAGGVCTAYGKQYGLCPA